MTNEEFKTTQCEAQYCPEPVAKEGEADYPDRIIYMGHCAKHSELGQVYTIDESRWVAIYK